MQCQNDWKEIEVKEEEDVVLSLFMSIIAMCVTQNVDLVDVGFIHS